MFHRPSPWPARVLAFICLSSFGAVGAALIAQHGFDIRPCPWCVMQRVIFLALGTVSGLAWLLRRVRPALVGLLLGCVVLAVLGLWAAYFQWDVASKLASCDMTLADTFLRATDLEMRVPYLFMVTAGCNEAAKYKLLGLTYEIWSGALFLLQGLLALSQLRAAAKRS